MFKQVALATILTVTFTITINGQPPKNFATDGNRAKLEESVGGPESAKAIARLGDLSLPAIRERLKQMRQLSSQPAPLLVKLIIESQKLPIVYNKRTDKLKAAVQPVLDYHGRNWTPIYVLLSQQPMACLVERSVIIITTRMMVIASDEEIRGIIAHELAHEYVWDERVKAKKENDGKLMQECELFCDAVAAFTLKEIGDDPASYGRIMERLTEIGIITRSATRHQSDTHPSLDARKKLNKFLCQRLG